MRKVFDRRMSPGSWRVLTRCHDHLGGEGRAVSRDFQVNEAEISSREATEVLEAEVKRSKSKSLSKSLERISIEMSLEFFRVL